MHIGVPKEIKNHEYRAGLTASSVKELTARGHQVSIETGLGAGVGISDDEYAAAGAQVLKTAKEIFAGADMIVKVKEPQPQECALLRPGQILFTYLHLAPDAAQTQALLKSGCSAIAYETVQTADGRLPLLTPMSEVAGRLSIQVGAHYLEKAQGGRGILLGGVPGVAAADILIIGAGISGTNAMQMAIGLGANVSILDKNMNRLREIDQQFHGRVETVYSSVGALEHRLRHADLVIGAVLVPGAAAPKLVKRKDLKIMKQGAVMVDIAIDQGGCFESSRPTTHQDPIYVEDGIIHYCVTNMPGAVPRTSSFALNNVTLPYALALADHGLDALRKDASLAAGLNVHAGKLTNAAVAEEQNLKFVSPLEAIG
jgi:alanine dehydrogenase